MTKPILSPNQEQILETLLPVAQIATNNTNNTGELKPRMHTLICAPSGTGKSHLMKQLGKIIDAPVLFLNVSSWILTGCRGESNHTFDVVIKFMDNNPRGIIILDELDKINGREDWANYIRLEIHDLLDGVIPQACLMPSDDDDDDDDDIFSCNVTDNSNEKRQELEEKLMNHFFIVGGGAWQHLWEKRSAKKSMGFSTVPTSAPSPEKVTIDSKKLKTTIKPELLKRFSDEILIMQPMSKDDYLAMSPKFAKSLPPEVASEFIKIVKSEVDNAIDQQLGMRFFESALRKVMIAMQKKNNISLSV